MIPIGAIAGFVDVSAGKPDSVEAEAILAAWFSGPDAFGQPRSRRFIFGLDLVLCDGLSQGRWRNLKYIQLQQQRGWLVGSLRCTAFRIISISDVLLQVSPVHAFNITSVFLLHSGSRSLVSATLNVLTDTRLLTSHLYTKYYTETCISLAHDVIFR